MAAAFEPQDGSFDRLVGVAKIGGGVYLEALVALVHGLIFSAHFWTAFGAKAAPRK